ncbi:type I restriction enzyme, S subunit [Marivirga sericea]|jgi:type I restriction enzyme S subunit|uniref:Type I restriction enzyme, S subunit n=1 Tax=Marivirga sericea TaxID=1028 RepID=A0A1X7J4N8_9BACT|nr:restriction endonuclease subunit S [Marivirga sericea]SMG22633.1 type I restriction enzyme, S subunit [Marivirga sericea]
MKSTWLYRELGEIIKTTSGGTPLRSNSDFYNGNIPWIKSGELKHNIIFNAEEHISEEAIRKSSAKLFPAGTILIALYGATIGKLAILGIPASTNQAVCGIYKNDIFETKFLFNYLFHKKQKLIDQGAGGAQPNISQTILKKLSVPVVPLPEQRSIVSKIEQLFSELDNGIVNLKSAKEKLEVYRQAVLKRAFEGELTKEWRFQQDLPNAAEPIPIYVKNENIKNELPKDWEWVKLGSVLLHSKEKYKPETIQKQFYIGLEHILKDKGELSNNVCEEVIKTVKNKFKKGQILYGKLRPYLNKAYLAKESGVCSTDILVFDLSKNILGEFAINYILSRRFVNDMSENTSGVNLPRVSTKYINNYLVPLPHVSEQKQIVQEIESRLSVSDKLAESINESLEKSEALRQSILKKAFSGELLTEKELDACKQEADWEPAEKLLERIKKSK